MSQYIRLSPAEVYNSVIVGDVLVCSYEGDDKFKDNHLEGAISFENFLAKHDSYDSDTPITFYCA